MNDISASNLWGPFHRATVGFVITLALWSCSETKNSSGQPDQKDPQAETTESHQSSLQKISLRSSDTAYMQRHLNDPSSKNQVTSFAKTLTLLVTTTNESPIQTYRHYLYSKSCLSMGMDSKQKLEDFEDQLLNTEERLMAYITVLGEIQGRTFVLPKKEDCL